METVRSGTDWFLVDNASAVGSARRPAVALAERLGFGETRTGDVGIVVSELAANLNKHASAGALGIQVALRGGVAGIRVISLDHGPGMADVQLAALDGHSTSGTLGVGLGAVLRLSNAVDISSVPRRGTVLVADVWPEAGSGDDPAPPGLDVAGVTRPIANESTCGDAVSARTIDDTHLMMVSDGLGHGPLAADASAEAINTFHATTTTDPAAMLTALHRHMQGTRGAAVAVVAVAAGGTTGGRLTFAGIGNISVFVVTPDKRSAAMSQPGIIGHQVNRLRAVDLDFPADALLVMHSDGVRDSWRLRDTPGLDRRAPAVIAASVLRDAGTRPDDASVLVARRRA